MLNFMRYKFLYFALSLIVIIPGTISLIKFGLKPSIDFTGGTLWEIKTTQPPVIEANIQKTDNTYTLRTKPLSEPQHQELAAKIASTSGEFEEIRFETVGPILGQELLKK